MRVDWLIVGAGFTGATLAERIAAELNERVLLVDRRAHVGGNAYDEYNEHGILVHRYGPHVFHTNSKRVWDYLSRFTMWRPYFHRVVAMVDGKPVPLPFNLNSIDMLFPGRHAERLSEKAIQAYGFGARVPILRLVESEDTDLRFLGEYIYEKVFEGYTIKQWGMDPKELDPSVTARVPFYVGRDDRYFQDTYQGIPTPGYTSLFQRMLSSPNIGVLLKVDYREIVEEVRFKRMIYTGPIDEFFDYMYGPLPYRSIRFVFETVRQEFYQHVATVNYPNNFDFTRITEQKHLTGQRSDYTTLVLEYPEPYRPRENEPYYPIPRRENQERYALYAKEAAKLKTVLFAGRLADYRYYNMDQAVARALSLFEKSVSR